MSVGVVGRGVRQRQNEPRDIPNEALVSPPAADTFSSLKVSQQDVDQAAGVGRVEVRHNGLCCPLLELGVEIWCGVTCAYGLLF